MIQAGTCTLLYSFSIEPYFILMLNKLLLHILYVRCDIFKKKKKIVSRYSYTGMTQNAHIPVAYKRNKITQRKLFFVYTLKILNNFYSRLILQIYITLFHL